MTTATTMITNVVVASSLGGLLVGCVLLLTGTVSVVVVVEGEVVLKEIDAVERKCNTCHYGRIHKNEADYWIHGAMQHNLPK